jgi:hypothetical protein
MYGSGQFFLFFNGFQQNGRHGLNFDRIASGIFALDLDWKASVNQRPGFLIQLRNDIS